jgi:ADP-heptose:LPS heptosyltransferase
MRNATPRVSSGAVPESYLFIRLSALGDVIFGLETLAALKATRPDAEVDWVVEDRCAEVLVGHPDLRRVIVYPRRRLARAWRRPWLWPAAAAALARHVRALRARRYDAALDLHGNAKSGLHLLVARARRKLAFAPPASREGAARAAGEIVRLPSPLPHRAERGAHMLRALGLETGPRRPDLPPEQGDGDAFWRQAAGRGPRVVLIPGSSAFGAFKRWPAERYGELADRLVAATDARVAVSSGPGEEALAAAVRRGREGRLAALPGGGLGLMGLLAVLRRADLVIGGDTGPLHLASAAGVPVLAIYGPKDPALYGPRGRSRVLRNPVPCSPCTLRTCPAPLCVLGVHVREVAEAALALLRPEAEGEVRSR